MLRILALAVVYSLLFTSCTKDKAASGEKVLNTVVSAKVKGFDPIDASDMYAGNEVARVYEGLLQFHYLKRPYELAANLAAEMPSVSDDGLTYTFKLKQGVMFHDNKCFPNGKGREMTSADVVYNFKRLGDPKLQSTGWWLVDGKIKGLNEWRDKYANAEAVNYDEDIEGIKAVDKYTVQFKLVKKFPQFLYAFAMPFTYVHPKEAVEYYKKEFLNNPVGTGPFMTGVYTQGNKIVYTKNPNYRDEFYPSEGGPGDEAAGLLEDAGKKIPLVDKIVVNIITEEQTRWLNFLKGKLDSMSIPTEQFGNVMVPGKGLTEEFKGKGFNETKNVAIDLTFTSFNHANPLFKNNLKLRQAISLAFDRDLTNRKFYQGISIPAQSIVPPGVKGFIEGFKGKYQTQNLELAKKLLAEAGYPGGKGLPEITMHYTSSTVGRQIAEVFARDIANIGVKIKPIGVSWPELLKLVNTKQTMMFGMAWGADYPDAENFFQLLYSKNAAPGSNGSNYSNAEFDAMYEKAVLMEDSDERTALYEKMYKFVSDEVPMVFGFNRVAYGLLQGWFKNYKFIEFDHGISKYFNIDLAKKEELSKKL